MTFQLLVCACDPCVTRGVRRRGGGDSFQRDVSGGELYDVIKYSARESKISEGKVPDTRPDIILA